MHKNYKSSIGLSNFMEEHVMCRLVNPKKILIYVNLKGRIMFEL